jgi:hypothetical protein
MTVTGAVAWFDLTKQFCLRGAGRRPRRRLLAHVGAQGGWLCLASAWDHGAGQDRGKQRVAEVLEIDTSTARPGANEPILRKPKA